MNYVRVGCFKDKPDRRAMTLLASYRNPEDNTMDWNDLKTSVVDKCARKVRLILHWFGYWFVQINTDSTNPTF